MNHEIKRLLRCIRACKERIEHGLECGDAAYTDFWRDRQRQHRDSLAEMKREQKPGYTPTLELV